MTLPDQAPPVKPKLRGVSHEIAFFVVLLAGPLLYFGAHSGSARIALTVYIVCLAALFGVSALFHRVTWSPPARRRMRRLDHSMIFVFIAGTYTAAAGLTLRDSWASFVVPVVWIGALAGVLVKLFWLDAPKPVAASMYIGLGWVAIVALPALWSSLGPVGFSLLVGGGVLYTLGAIVYARHRPDPVPEVFGYHEVFHAFVIAAATCHYFVVAFFALPQA